MYTNKELRVTVLELIEVCDLTDTNTDGEKIPVTLHKTETDEFLFNFIKEVVENDFIEPTDEFSGSSQKMLNVFKEGGFDNAPTLKQEIQQADRLKELKEIAKAEPEFKSIRGKLSSFRTLESLKEEMLILFSGKKPSVKEQELPPEETPQEVAEKLHDQNIEKKETKISHEIEDVYPIGRLTMKCSEIKMADPFQTLFGVKENTLESIIENMQKNGFDEAFPIILWHNIVIDGHTRLEAAEAVGIIEIPVEQKEFPDEKEALNYAIHNQRDRRNLSDAELLKCVEAIDKPMTKKEAGQKTAKNEPKEKTEKTHEKTAKTLGVGKSKISDARKVLKDETAKEEVISGKKTISGAAKELREKEKPEKEIVVLKKTRIDAVAKFIKVTKGKTMSKEVFIKEVDIIFIFDEEFQGKSNIKATEKAVDLVLPILTALGILVIQENDEILIQDYTIG